MLTQTDTIKLKKMKTKSELKEIINSNLPDNSTGLITPAKHRAVLNAIIDHLFISVYTPVLGVLDSSFGEQNTVSNKMLSRWGDVSVVEQTIGGRTLNAMNFPGGMSGWALPDDDPDTLPTDMTTLISVWVTWDGTYTASDADIMSNFRRGESAPYDKGNFLFRIKTGKPQLYTLDDSLVQSGVAEGATMTANVPVHLVAEFNHENNEIAVWSDGVRGTPASVDSFREFAAHGILLGRRDYVDPSVSGYTNPSDFTGKMANLVIVKKENLAVSDVVSALYNSGVPPVLGDLDSTVSDNAILGYENNGDLFPGVWTWFNDPRAIREGDYTYIGAVTSTGGVHVRSYNHVTEAWAVSGEIATLGIEDDHSNPGLLILSDGSLAAFWTGHRGPIKMSKTNISKDVTTFGAATTVLSNVDCSYAHPLILSGEANALYVYFRLGTNPADRFFIKSTDDGATWGSEVKLVDSSVNRPYWKVTSNGVDRVDFFFGDGQPSEVFDNNLYHMYYTGGNYYKSDGTLIGDESTMPITGAASATKVWDQSVEGFSQWVWDVMILEDGNPAVAFTSFESNFDNHVYNVARWNGSSWDVSEVVSGGGSLNPDFGNDYSGGITLISDTEVVCSIESSTGTFELWLYTTTDFVTWTGVPMTENSAYSGFSNEFATDNIRPYYVRGTDKNSPLSLLWCRGDYRTYLDYDMDVVFGVAKP